MAIPTLYSFFIRLAQKNVTIYERDNEL
ncbi:hypothetical protein [Campylobacter portucalensis]|nr:hypothetical protein [Campylobacter portucalensis]